MRPLELFSTILVAPSILGRLVCKQCELALRERYCRRFYQINLYEYTVGQINNVRSEVWNIINFRIKVHFIHDNINQM